MKIGDQKPVTPPVPGTDPASESTTPAQGAGFAEQLEEAGEVGGGEAGGPLGDLEALAERIDQGDLSTDQAMQLIVERVLDSQLGPDSPAGLRDKARALVREALSADPHLQALTRRLGGDQ